MYLLLKGLSGELVFADLQNLREEDHHINFNTFLHNMFKCNFLLDLLEDLKIHREFDKESCTCVNTQI